MVYKTFNLVIPVYVTYRLVSLYCFPQVPGTEDEVYPATQQ
jgi:hypothetical protein